MAHLLTQLQVDDQTGVHKLVHGLRLQLSAREAIQKVPQLAPLAPLPDAHAYELQAGADF